MKNTKISTLYNLVCFFVVSFIAGMTVFTRSFVGIYFNGFRLGEYLIGGGFILCLALLALSIFYKNKVDAEIFNNYYRAIILSFFIILLLTNSNILNTYAFKSSSYIWTVGFIFIGIFINRYIIKANKGLIFLGSLVPLSIFIINTGNYPDVIINFFKENSDKFQFTKASDVFISIVTVYFFLEILNISSSKKIFFIFFYVPLFLPMLIIQSRGSYVGIIIFTILVFYFERRFLSENKKVVFFYLLFSIIVFGLSTFRASGQELNSDITPAKITEQVQTNSEVKDTRKAFLTFYFQDGRLFSKDETTNWRLDIWQDVTYDLFEENKIFVGYGYKSIIPQMLDPTAPGRLGRDGLNENVHNYFVTILSRGGLFQLILFILFHFSLIRLWHARNNNYKILIYYLPTMFVSSLDISMDGVQFPLIFYSSIGCFLANINSNK